MGREKVTGRDHRNFRRIHGTTSKDYGTLLARVSCDPGHTGLTWMKREVGGLTLGFTVYGEVNCYFIGSRASIKPVKVEEISNKIQCGPR